MQDGADCGVGTGAVLAAEEASEAGQTQCFAWFVKSVAALIADIDLVQRRQVVENPEAATLGRRDEVLLLHRQVGDGHLGQVELERLPLAPSSKQT